MVKEIPAHSIINSFYIKLNGHKTSPTGHSLKIIYKFLHYQNIIRNREASNKGLLLRTNQSRKDWLQLANQNLGIDLLHSSIQVD